MKAAFISGARQGWELSIGVILPNLLLSFVLVRFLLLSGLLTKLTMLGAPLMRFWDLPGEAIAVLLSAWVCIASGVGVAMSLYYEGVLSSQSILVLIPGIYLLGAQLQYLGRIIAVIELRQHIWLMYGLAIVNAIGGMTLARYLCT